MNERAERAEVIPIEPYLEPSEAYREALADAATGAEAAVDAIAVAAFGLAISSDWAEALAEKEVGSTLALEPGMLEGVRDPNAAALHDLYKHATRVLAMLKGETS